MNLELDCSKWSRETWQTAYAEYCQKNIYGPMTKREYYDFVQKRCNRIKTAWEPLSGELQNTWTTGWRSATRWAKERKCNMNGESIENIKPQVDINQLANDVKDLQWATMNKRI